MGGHIHMWPTPRIYWAQYACTRAHVHAHTMCHRAIRIHAYIAWPSIHTHTYTYTYTHIYTRMYTHTHTFDLQLEEWDRFEPYRRGELYFTPMERQRLLYSILCARPVHGGAGVDVSRCAA